MASHRVVTIILTFCAGIIFVLVAVSMRLAPESAPVARGAATPGVYICLECHGKNDGNFPNDWALSCNHQTDTIEVPHYEGQCGDMLAFFAAVRVRSSFLERTTFGISSRLLAGEGLARRFYCFQCHGEPGQGGFPNSGSMKGYVPGYFGEDFRELTNDASPIAVEAWIRDGTNPDLMNKIIEGPIATHFIERQAIQMLQFNHLSNSELSLLVDYVIALNELGPMDATAVRKYAKLTQSPLPTGRKIGLLHYTGMQH
jgi:cytochrome c553